MTSGIGRSLATGLLLAVALVQVCALDASAAEVCRFTGTTDPIAITVPRTRAVQGSPTRSSSCGAEFAGRRRVTSGSEPGGCSGRQYRPATLNPGPRSEMPAPQRPAIPIAPLPPDGGDTDCGDARRSTSLASHRPVDASAAHRSASSERLRLARLECLAALRGQIGICRSRPAPTCEEAAQQQPFDHIAQMFIACHPHRPSVAQHGLTVPSGLPGLNEAMDGCRPQHVCFAGTQPIAVLRHTRCAGGGSEFDRLLHPPCPGGAQ